MHSTDCNWLAPLNPKCTARHCRRHQTGRPCSTRHFPRPSPFALSCNQSCPNFPVSPPELCRARSLPHAQQADVGAEIRRQKMECDIACISKHTNTHPLTHTEKHINKQTRTDSCTHTGGQLCCNAITFTGIFHFDSKWMEMAAGRECDACAMLMTVIGGIFIFIYYYAQLYGK